MGNGSSHTHTNFLSPHLTRAALPKQLAVANNRHQLLTALVESIKTTGVKFGITQRCHGLNVLHRAALALAQHTHVHIHTMDVEEAKVETVKLLFGCLKTLPPLLEPSMLTEVGVSAGSA